MYTPMLLKSDIGSSFFSRQTRKPWPTMYDLPSENPEDLGVPDIFHNQQPQLLKETFQSPLYASDNFFVATDFNLYYDRQHFHWYKRPDWFVVIGVHPLYQRRDLRNSYVMWDEQVTPLLVVELLSPSTEAEDLGRTSSSDNEPPTKWKVYEQILKIPYYVVFSRHTDRVRFFKLISGSYVEQPTTLERLWVPEVQLGIGKWKGIYDGLDRQWLRWSDKEGLWLPTLAEQKLQAERQKLQAERQKLQAERQKFQAEQQVASEREQKLQAEQRALIAEEQAANEREHKFQAEQRALIAEQRAQQLAAQLQALGINILG